MPFVTITPRVKKIVRRGAPGPASATPNPTFDSITMNTSASPPGSPVQGQFWWDADEETISFKQDGTTLQLGQEVHWHVRNNSGVTIADGTPVMATGTIGASGKITITKMDGTDPANAKFLLGITTEEILDGEDGKVTTFGKVRGLNTTGTPQSETWIDGDILWISATTVGELTNIEPTPPALGMPVAFVIFSSATVGTLAVRVTPIDEHLIPSIDQNEALDGSNSPSASNVFLTNNDVIDYADPKSITGAQSIPSINKNKHHVCTGTTADYTLNLPTTGITSGDLFSFEMSAALTELVTLDALAGQLIDGQQTRIMWSGEKAVLKWDGSNWQKISGVSIPASIRIEMRSDMNGLSSGVWHKMLMDTAVIIGPFILSGNGAKLLRPMSIVIRGQVRAIRWTGVHDYIGASVWPVSLGSTAAAVFDEFTQTNSTIPLSEVNHNAAFVVNDIIELRGISSVNSWDAYGISTGLTTNMNITEVPTW